MRSSARGSGRGAYRRCRRANALRPLHGDGAWTTVLRDAACVAATPGGGSLLALGTRDGFVYASTDDGESMTEVARHLPDVLCVRALADG